MKKIVVYAIMFIITHYVQAHELPIAVVIASYNNNRLFEGRLLYEQNLESIVAQHYDNYRIVYVDDCSTDGTADAVELYAREHNFLDKITLVRNTKRWGPSRNRYIGAHLCLNNEIVCILDGDDFFAHKNVLARVNQEYQSSNVWVTYGQFQTVPNNTLSGGKKTPRWVVKKHAYREFGWYYHSLKTFYAWLFKKIALQDLLYEGTFFTAASDLAEMFPLIEMSAGRFAYIPDVLYLASQHPNNEIHIQGRKFMARMGEVIMKERPAYPPLEYMDSIEPCDPQEIPVYIRSEYNQLLYLKDEHTFVVVVESEHDKECYYNEVYKKMPHIMRALQSTKARSLHVVDYPKTDALSQLLDISGVASLHSLYAGVSKDDQWSNNFGTRWCTIYYNLSIFQERDAVQLVTFF